MVATWQWHEQLNSEYTNSIQSSLHQLSPAVQRQSDVLYDFECYINNVEYTYFAGAREDARILNVIANVNVNKRENIR